MSAVEVGLVVCAGLLTVAALALGRAAVASGRRLTTLERRVGRMERRAAGREAEGPPALTSSPAPRLPAEPEGDAVDLRGTDVDGEPTVVGLERHPRPTALVFLSTSCGICVGIWERLRSDGLGEVGDVRPVVVTKDADEEDVARVRELSGPDLTVALSSEAWEDYEVPGSPYVVVVSADPGSVVGEGAPARWEDVVSAAAAAVASRPGLV